MAKNIVKLILSTFIGGIASFVLILISEGIHTLVTCRIVGFLVCIFAYRFSLGSNLEKLISIASFIGAFILYFYVYNYVNENTESNFVAVLVFFCPYIIFTYSLTSQNNTSEEEKKESE